MENHCEKHNVHHSSFGRCFMCERDDYLNGRSLAPRPEEPMSKSSVEALVKTMLGPIEDRFCNLAFQISNILDRIENLEKDRTAPFSSADVVVPKADLARLHQIEHFARAVCFGYERGYNFGMMRMLMHDLKQALES